jgi:hypothetical protein
MGILPLSFPSTPVRPTTRSAFTLPPHLPRVFRYPQHRRPKRWSGGFSRFRLVLGVARSKNGLSRVNYTPQLIIERGTKEWGQRNRDKGIRFSCLRSPAVLSPRNIVPSPANRPIWTATIPRRHFRPAGVRAGVAGDPTAYFTGDLSRAGGFGDFGKERGKHEILSMPLSPKRLPGESLDALV